VIVCALQLVGGLAVAAQVYFVTKVVSALLASQRGDPVTAALPSIIALAGLITYSGVAFAIIRQKQRLLAFRAERATRQQILDVAGGVDLWSYETSGFYDRLRRVQASAATRPYFLTLGLIGLAGGLAGAVSVAVAVVVIQPVLLPLIVASGVPVWMTGRRSSRREFSFAVAITPVQRMRDYLDTTLTGRSEAKELRAFGAVGALRKRYDDAYEEYARSLRAHLKVRQRLGVIGMLGSGILIIGTFTLLIWLVQHHHINLSQVAGAVVGIRLLSAQISQLSNGAQQIFESSLFLDDLEGFLRDRPQPRVAPKGRHARSLPTTPRRPAPRGFDRLEVERVSFAYPGSEHEALDEVSLSMRRGQVVALVGENGSGKTTLAKLLAGLYEPDAGVIRWDGVDTVDYEAASLRESIAVIFQDFVQYQLTARENVGLGKPDAIDDVAAIKAAAEQAGADDLISALPHGYETILSKQFEDGQDLSLGQWQRVALARAFYRDAPFIILDEPSASLDPRAEADLFAKVQTLLRGRTVLLISHRFSSVRYADSIYVMRAGQVVEHGNHVELMRAGGLYADLFTTQAAAYIDAADVE
jgi:ATP-binding cassette subfamily B protein